MRVLLVEPWYGGSHRAWADGYVAHSGHEVHLVTHADRTWRWRLQGGALTLADDIARVVAEVGPPEVVVVSSMVNLPALLGFSRRSLGSVPVACYVHESQLLYPVAAGGVPDPRLALVNWLTVAAADLVVFNSSFHREGLLRALPGFLDRSADEGHVAHVDAVATRSVVLPVGVDLARLSPEHRPAPDGGPPTVLWSHRWEWDKRIEEALAILVRLAAEGVGFRVVLAGQQPDRTSPAVRRLVGELGDRVVHQGHLGRRAYTDQLLRSDVVLSTAVQEFFGIAVVEAVAAGCVPVLPDDLSYPEVIPEPWWPAALHDRAGTGPEDHLRAVLEDLPAARAATAGLAAAMRRFDWSVVAPLYDDRLDRLRGAGG